MREHTTHHKGCECWEAERDATIRRMRREKAAMRDEAAAVCARLAEMMEAGAGELRPGQRLRQAERLIRALRPKPARRKR